MDDKRICMKKKNFSFSVLHLGAIVILYYFISPTLRTFFPKTIGVLDLSDEFFVLFLFIYVFLYINKFPKRPAIYLFLFAFWGLLSGIIKAVPLKILFAGMFLQVKGPLLFICASMVPINKRVFFSFAKAFLCFFVVVLLFSFIDIFGGLAYKDLLKLKVEYRFGVSNLNSIFIHPSTLAFFSFSLAFFLLVFTKKKKFFLSLVTIIGIYSFRIKEIFGFFISVFLRKQYLSIKYIIGVLVLGLISFIIYKNIIPWHYNQYFSASSIDTVARLALYFTSVKIGVNEFPFGEGFGRFGGEISARYYSPVFKKYNIDKVFGLSIEDPKFVKDTFWPMVLGETGFIGLILYILLLASIFKFALVQNTGFLCEKSEKLIMSVRICFVFLLISSLAKPVFSQSPHMFLAFFYTGMVYSYLKSGSSGCSVDSL